MAAVLHVLFHLDTPLIIPEAISDQALLAAQNFVELCNQYTAFLAEKHAVELIWYLHYISCEALKHVIVFLMIDLSI